MFLEPIFMENGKFQWVDVLDPQIADLERLTKEYGIEPISIQDSLDPNRLPKFEVVEDYTFIILRYYDYESEEESGTVHELTNKISIYIRNQTLITVHRHEAPFLTSIKEKWLQNPANQGAPVLPKLLNKIIKNCLHTYSPPITDCQNKAEEFEAALFKNESSSSSIQEKFLLKRKMYVFKYLLRISEDVISKIKIISDYDASLFQDLKESVHLLHFETKSSLENINNLINLNLSLASHKTNDVMRTLTLFSVIFLPLTFIAGIYGMNFDYMPELRYKYGYFIILFVMLCVALSMFIWFHRKGWLKK